MLFFRRFCVVVATAVLSTWLLTGCIASPQPQPPGNGDPDGSTSQDAGVPPQDASADGGDAGDDGGAYDAGVIDGSVNDGSTR